MTIYRNYFSKSNTLISSNLTNNSQNPVTEILYGSLNQKVSRFGISQTADFFAHIYTPA